MQNNGYWPCVSNIAGYFSKATKNKPQIVSNLLNIGDASLRRE